MAYPGLLRLGLVHTCVQDTYQEGLFLSVLKSVLVWMIKYFLTLLFLFKFARGYMQLPETGGEGEPPPHCGTVMQQSPRVHMRLARSIAARAEFQGVQSAVWHLAPLTSRHGSGPPLLLTFNS